MTRGGPRNRGIRLTTNTSGLIGIRFGRRFSRDGQQEFAYVYVSWMDRSGNARRASYSIYKHGKDGALERAIADRTSAGYDVPSLKECRRALALFLAS